VSTYGLARASDSDRDGVVDVLRDGYTAGRLTREEFDERTTAAYSAMTWDALRKLTADLPDLPAEARLAPQIVVSRRVPRHFGRTVRAFTIIGLAGVAGRVFPVTAWVVVVLISLVLVLAFTWRGR
jgi:hypothetical protein